MESIRSANTPLSEKQLFHWHQLLFTEKPILYDLTIGNYRNSTIQVVSERYGKDLVHFSAPCDNRNCVKGEMQQFLLWLNSTSPKNNKNISGYIKAAIAKLWFVTIHPFDDGNGRFSRIIAERCLAATEQTDLRLYSLSSEIEKHKSEYYNILEEHQRGNLGITVWIIWFLERIISAASASTLILNKIRYATFFWDKNRDIELNRRQKKLLIRLLNSNDFADGISRKKHKNLVGTSDATASRDLSDLLAKGILLSSGSGRSVKYKIRVSTKS